MSRRSRSVKESSSRCSAGYSDTGTCTSPNWMAPFQSCRGMVLSPLAAGGRRGVHQPGHAAHRRALDGVSLGGGAAPGLACELHGPAGVRGAVERLDDADVGEALLAGGLGIAVA